MEEEKSKKPAKKNENKKLDRELDNTFPASDPPSHTRPGHNRDKDDDKQS